MIDQEFGRSGGTGRPRAAVRWKLPFSVAFAALCAMLQPAVAQASMFKGETLDKVADVLAIVVLIIVPVIGIAVFWMVHVLPEKIAEKNHHPQAKAIQTLCLLSLVFGGLLWPIAWLWAFTKPVLYKMAYGTDKAEGHEGHPPAPSGDLVDEIVPLPELPGSEGRDA